MWRSLLRQLVHGRLKEMTDVAFDFTWRTGGRPLAGPPYSLLWRYGELYNPFLCSFLCYQGIHKTCSLLLTRDWIIRPCHAMPPTTFMDSGPSLNTLKLGTLGFSLFINLHFEGKLCYGSLSQFITKIIIKISKTKVRFLDLKNI